METRFEKFSERANYVLTLAELAFRLIKLFTRSDQTVVLDPFSGIGSSVLATENMGKTGIGLELSADYISKELPE